MAGPMHGRSQELSRVRELLSRSLEGTLGMIVLEGEPGIGKSTLIAEAIELARADEAQVFSGRAEGPGTGPFGPFLQSLGTHPEAADRRSEAYELLSRPQDVDAGVQFRIVDALVEVLEAAALRGPTLLTLDDLQWADASTLITLRAVLQRLGSLPLAILTSCRPWPRTQELAELIDFASRQGAEVIGLSPLADEDVDHIVQDVMKKAPGPILRDQLRRAGGNPMFVGEIIRTLRDEEALITTGEVAEARETVLPESLTRVLLRRLSYLSKDSLRLLEMASVLGSAFSLSELAAITDVTGSQLMTSLHEPLAAGLLEDDGGTMRFRHDVIREAIYGNISPSVRSLLHRDLARRLLARGSSSGPMARHLLEGATPDDEGDIALLRSAAAEIFPSDPAAAIDLLRDTLRSTKSPRWLDEIRADLVDYLAYSENAVEAERMARETLASLQTRHLQPRLRSALVHALFTQGKWGDVIAEVELAKTVLEIDDVTRGRLIADAVLAHAWNGDLDRAQEDADEAMSLGTQTQDALTLSLALAHSSVLMGGSGQPMEGVRLAERAVDIATSASSLDAQRRQPQMALGMALVAADRLEEARQVLAEGRRISERTGMLWALPLYNSMLTVALYNVGAWDDAIAEAESAVAAGEEIGTGAGLVAAFSLLASIAIDRGEMSVAEKHLLAADEIIASKGPQWGMWTWLVHARAAAIESKEGPERALEYLRKVWESAPPEHLGLGAGLHLARLAAARDDHDLLEMVTESVAPSSLKASVPYENAAAQICRGLIEEDGALLREAAVRLDASGRKPEAAAAWADAGEMFGRSARTEDARGAFLAALERYEAIGSKRGVARVSAAMRAAGLRRGSRGVRGRPTVGWDALTPTELEVVRLAAKGLTNPAIAEHLFISRQTVKTHLSHVFAKLNISSRVHLSAEAAERGL